MVWESKLPVGNLHADNEVVVVPEILIKMQFNLCNRTSKFKLCPVSLLKMEL